MKEETREQKIIGVENVNLYETTVDTDCPLSPKDWVMFLSYEIYNLEYTRYRVISSIYPTAAILAAVGAGIISWMLAVPQFLPLINNRVNVFNTVSFFSKLVGNIVLVLFAIVIYGYISFYRPTGKKIEELKLTRQKIISGQLINPDKIREEWQKIV